MIQRGNNRSAIFFSLENYEHYRNWLAEAAAEYGCLIHAYVLMTHPADYRWSSYRAHAHGAPDALVSDHPLYRALGRGATARQTAYRYLF